jgi:hypothetical protein
MLSIDREPDPRKYGSTPAEASCVARILELRASGMGQLAIARALDAEGLRSRTGQPWSSSVIGTILRRNGGCSTLPGPSPAASRAEAPAPKDQSVLALARTGCTQGCNGLGRLDGGEVCSCVHHRVFNSVMGKFRYLAAGHHLNPPVPIDLFLSGGRGKSGHSRMANQEFLADVHLVAKRTLDEADFKLFKYRYLLGADVKLCAARLGLEHQATVQRLEAIEVKLGEAFRTCAPYSLYPVSGYFGERIPGGARPCPRPGARIQERGPLRPPLAALPAA